MHGTTMQRHEMAAAGAARVRDAYVAVNRLMAGSSWSIPCPTVTFHKLRPRRPQVLP
jgi:hypothetical protein